MRGAQNFLMLKAAYNTISELDEIACEVEAENSAFASTPFRHFSCPPPVCTRANTLTCERERVLKSHWLAVQAAFAFHERAAPLSRSTVSSLGSCDADGVALFLPAAGTNLPFSQPSALLILDSIMKEK